MSYVSIGEGINMNVYFGNNWWSKSRIEFVCVCCTTERPRKTRYVLIDNQKICYVCMDYFLKCTEKNFNTIIGKLKGFQKRKNKEKNSWDKEIVIEAI